MKPGQVKVFERYFKSEKIPHRASSVLCMVTVSAEFYQDKFCRLLVGIKERFEVISSLFGIHFLRNKKLARQQFFLPEPEMALIEGFRRQNDSSVPCVRSAHLGVHMEERRGPRSRSV